ncbi:MAG TPA: type II toxin-antitoxin system YhaV family toxin [Drouetiella sp.]
MEANGWQLYQHSLFKSELNKLIVASEKIKAKEPDSYGEHPTVKLLAKILKLITEEIPGDPGHECWNLGNTLGKEYRHWKRAKFGRYRLFFRYRKDKKVIVYVWVNDTNTQRKDGDRNDPYAIFARGLERDNPPNSLEALLKESDNLEL